MNAEIIKSYLDLLNEGKVTQEEYEKLMMTYVELNKKETKEKTWEEKQQELKEKNRKQAEETRKRLDEMNKKTYENEEQEKREKNVTDEMIFASAFLSKIFDNFNKRVYSDEDIEKMSYYELISVIEQFKNSAPKKYQEIVNELQIENINISTDFLKQQQEEIKEQDLSKKENKKLSEEDEKKRKEIDDLIKEEQEKVGKPNEIHEAPQELKEKIKLNKKDIAKVAAYMGISIAGFILLGPTGMAATAIAMDVITAKLSKKENSKKDKKEIEKIIEATHEEPEKVIEAPIQEVVIPEIPTEEKIEEPEKAIETPIQETTIPEINEDKQESVIEMPTQKEIIPENPISMSYEEQKDELKREQFNAFIEEQGKCGKATSIKNKISDVVKNSKDKVKSDLSNLIEATMQKSKNNDLSKTQVINTNTIQR